MASFDGIFQCSLLRLAVSRSLNLKCVKNFGRFGGRICHLVLLEFAFILMGELVTLQTNGNKLRRVCVWMHGKWKK